jgi:hypothetical protein
MPRGVDMKIITMAAIVMALNGCDAGSMDDNEVSKRQFPLGSGGSIEGLSQEEINERAIVPPQRSFGPIVGKTTSTSTRSSRCAFPEMRILDPGCEDNDGDKVVSYYDCDDYNATISPRSFDVRCDGVDQNCNGYDECDRDGDGILNYNDCDDDDRHVGSECKSWFTGVIPSGEPTI